MFLLRAPAAFKLRLCHPNLLLHLTPWHCSQKLLVGFDTVTVSDSGKEFKSVSRVLFASKCEDNQFVKFEDCEYQARTVFWHRTVSEREKKKGMIWALAQVATGTCALFA